MSATSISTSQVGLQRPLPLARNVLHLFRDILASPQFWDGLKVFGVGAAIAGSKWVAESALEAVKSLVLAKAVFRGGDDAFDWVMLHLTRYGQWSHTAREVEILCRPKLGGSNNQDNAEDAAGSKALSAGTDGLKGVHFYPVASSSVHFTFEGVHVWASRSRALVGDSSFEESLTLSFLTFSSRTIRRFLIQAKESYDAHERGRVQVFTMDRYSYWTKNKSITRRREDSVHLPIGTKERLLTDARGFFTEERRLWYGDRGIPYRRGFLLWGVPGSGKTSLAHVIASTLELPIYQLSLSGHGMDDAKLVELMGSVPAASIVVLEDVDAAFTNRSSTSNGKMNGQRPEKESNDSPGVTTTSTSISFSSLLNAIDGIGASDSRLLIMTTNHREALDEALIRPGRVDVQVEFKNADRDQARELFLHWFSPARPAAATTTTTAATVAVRENEFTSNKAKAEEKHYGNVIVLDEGEKTDRQASMASALHGRLVDTDVDEKHVDVIPPAQEAPPPSSSSPSPSLEDSASIFSSTVPQGEFSVAALQGYLLTCSGLSHVEAAQGVKGWVEDQQQQGKEGSGHGR